jgi:hypothetical protein
MTFKGNDMKAMIAAIAVLLWGMGLVSSTVAAENNSSMPPLARVFGLCKGVPASLAYQGIPFSLGPLGNAQQYLKLYENQDVDVPPTTQVTVVVGPKHGKLIVTPSVSSSGYAGYDYVPEVGYTGKDSLTLRVEFRDKPITLRFL